MGDLVTLRPVTEDDLAWLASLRNSPAASGLHEWHGWTDPQRRRRQWAESGLLGDDGGTLIVLHDTDRVGHVSWRRVKTGPTAFGWAIAVGLAPDFRGRGYGSEAQRLLARYLFAHTQVNRIEATTEITNVAEQRALEKAGFTREGILRGTTFRQGRWHDHVIYSVLRDEVNLMDGSAEDGAGALAEGNRGHDGLGEVSSWSAGPGTPPVTCSARCPFGSSITRRTLSWPSRETASGSLVAARYRCCALPTADQGEPAARSR